MADPSRSIEVGTYQLSTRLGEGGSSQVYRAVGPGGAVAIKLLAPASELDEHARARLRREATALAQVRHPSLVALLDHGDDPDFGTYLVLPLLPGRTLRATFGDRAHCPEAAIALVLPIVGAVGALHAAGYVHRDLKPENVMAGPDGTITVIDLGLAWRAGLTQHTETGAAVGSVGYMAPEQIEGRAVDARADVYAIGVMLYECVVGRRPFARPRANEEAAAALVGVCPRLTAADRRADDALAELVAACLALDPTARPTSADLEARLLAMVDWADPAALADERAAVVADPAGYVARVAPLRARRAERLAREALAAGRPFAALAMCDRGLAYAADRPELLALVGEIEAATAAAPPPVLTSPAAPVAGAGGRSPRRRRIAAIAVVVGVAALVGVALWWRSASTPAAAPPPTTTAAQQAEGLGMARDMVAIFNRLLASDVQFKPTGTANTDDAAACRAAATSVQPQDTSACDRALVVTPDDPALRMARAMVRSRSGDRAGAQVDVDRACALGATAVCQLRF